MNLKKKKKEREEHNYFKRCSFVTFLWKVKHENEFPTSWWNVEKQEREKKKKKEKKPILNQSKLYLQKNKARA